MGDQSEYPKWLIIVLKEMFRRVHVRFTYKALKDEEWFSKHTWTLEEQADFTEWLRNWLDENCHKYMSTLSWKRSMPARLKKARLSHFILQFGWRTE